MNQRAYSDYNPVPLKSTLHGVRQPTLAEVKEIFRLECLEMIESPETEPEHVEAIEDFMGRMEAWV